MTKFIIIDDETKHFIKADIIDHVQSLYFERHHNGKQIEPFQSVLNVGNKQIHSPLTVDEIWKRIHDDSRDMPVGRVEPDGEVRLYDSYEGKFYSSSDEERLLFKEVGSAREKRIYHIGGSNHEVRVLNHGEIVWSNMTFTNYISALKEFESVKIDDDTPSGIGATIV